MSGAADVTVASVLVRIVDAIERPAVDTQTDMRYPAACQHAVQVSKWLMMNFLDMHSCLQLAAECCTCYGPATAQFERYVCFRVLEQDARLWVST